MNNIFSNYQIQSLIEYNIQINDMIGTFAMTKKLYIREQLTLNFTFLIQYQSFDADARITYTNINLKLKTQIDVIYKYLRLK